MWPQKPACATPIRFPTWPGWRPPCACRRSSRTTTPATAAYRMFACRPGGSRTHSRCPSLPERLAPGPARVGVGAGGAGQDAAVPPVAAPQPGRGPAARALATSTPRPCWPTVRSAANAVGRMRRPRWRRPRRRYAARSWRALPRFGAERESTEIATLSLADRFDTVLDSGRKIASSLSAEDVFRELQAAALRLLRGERCLLLQAESGTSGQRLQQFRGDCDDQLRSVSGVSGHRHRPSPGLRRGTASGRRVPVQSPVLAVRAGLQAWSGRRLPVPGARSRARPVRPGRRAAGGLRGYAGGRGPGECRELPGICGD